jgi:hypothetical protein
MIRPVKPTAPPPAPTPPRRHSSGIRNPDPAPESAMPPTTQHYNNDPPTTMAAARARIHEIARELPSDNRFGGPAARYDDETQGRVGEEDYRAAHAAYDRQFGGPQRKDAFDALPSFDHQANQPEHYPQHDPATELRPQYDEVLRRHEERGFGSDRPGSDRPLDKHDDSGKYERRGNYAPPPVAAYSQNSNSYDAAAYEANYPKARREEPSYEEPRRGSYRDPEPESSRREVDRGRSFRRESDEPRRGSYRDERDERRGSYQPNRSEQRDETRAEGNSTANRGKKDSWSKPPSDPPIPAPARVPAELRVPDNFVVGVQPLRTPSIGANAAFPQPQAVITPAYGGPATMAASPNAMGTQPPMTQGMAMQMGMPQITMPPLMPQVQPMQPLQPIPGLAATPNAALMHVRPHTSMGPRIAQPTEVEEAQQGSKVGRFAWFVFGAAFGIFFAFAATGFGFGKKDDAAQANFPPPVAIPAAPTVAPVQPIQQPVQPVQPAIIAQPVVPPQPQPMATVVQPPQPVVTGVALPAPLPGAPTGAQTAPIAPAPLTGVATAPPPPSTVATLPGVAPPGPPVRIRSVPIRRTPPRAAPRPAPQGDDGPAPAPAPKKPDNGADILGAGLDG